MDDIGNSIAVGEIGEVVLRGAVVALGYEHAEDGTISDTFSSDGWFKTGDMGYVNEEGMLWVVSRKKDVINRGGEKVWSCSLEERLRDLDVSVFSRYGLIKQSKEALPARNCRLGQYPYGCTVLIIVTEPIR